MDISYTRLVIWSRLKSLVPNGAKATTYSQLPQFWHFSSGWTSCCHWGCRTVLEAPWIDRVGSRDAVMLRRDLPQTLLCHMIRFHIDPIGHLEGVDSPNKIEKPLLGHSEQCCHSFFSIFHCYPSFFALTLLKFRFVTARWPQKANGEPALLFRSLAAKGPEIRAECVKIASMQPD